MKVTFKATKVELSDELKRYTMKRLGSVDKLLDKRVDPSAVWAQVELEKTTEHHNLGPVYRAEVNLHVAGDYFRAESTADSLQSAIDLTKGELVRLLDSGRKKKETLVRRGARSVKWFLRGATSWPPFNKRH